MIKFVNLHGHSTFSTFDGYGYPDKHIDVAVSKGMNALALTDHGNMNGLTYQILHSKKLKKEGVEFKPIFGIEAYFIDSYEDWKKEYEQELEDDDAEKVDEEDRKSNKRKYAHLVLLAKNEVGYNNLCKIVSESYGKYFYRKPRIDFELLKKYSEGIIALSACLAGNLARMMWDYLEKDDLGKTREEFIDELVEKSNKFREIFGDDWYLELQWNAIPEQHIYNYFLIDVSKKTGTKLVSTCDAHYPSRDDWEAREIYKKIGWLGANFTPEWAKELVVNKDELKYELYVKNGEELFAEYKRYSEICNCTYDDAIVLESIERTAEIADSIDSFYPDTKAKFPHFILEEGEKSDEVLRKICSEKMLDFQLNDNEKYAKRLEFELETIISKGFAEYFLTMKKIADFASSKFLTGPGRGSAAGSLVSYLLGITQIDPLKYNLLFSRFLRKDSDGYPDIDYDVSERDKLVLHLTKHWGENCVVPITNWNTLSIKSLTKDLAKLLEIPFQEVNEVTRGMDDEASSQAKEEAGVKSGVYKLSVDEYIKHSPMFSEFLEKYPDIEKYLRLLEGQIRSQSRHAGGVLIVDNIDKKMPLIRGSSLKKEDKQERIDNGLKPYIFQTPWTEGQHVRHLEPMGFIKFDILGLETLSIIEKTVGLILKKKNGKEPTFEEIKEYYRENLSPDKLNLADENVYKNIFHSGKWAGIFQFTETGAQNFCSQVKPNSIEDISAITSIYRPGPLGAKVHEKYLEARKWPNKIKYDHPLHKEVSENTYGFLIYQEQIAMLAHKLGKNISLDEGDLLRKVLTKKGTGKDDVKDKIKNKFIDGCLEKGLTETKAEEIWETFILFSGYGFNKSHAISYSIISYICAWLLNYYPDEWLASYLDTEMDEKSSKKNKKEKSINIVRSMGYEVKDVDINLSQNQWIPTYNKELVQPISVIKGIGEKALEEIINNRPFKSIEELVFHPTMSYRKVSKKIMDVLVKSGALDELWKKSGFTNQKHLWSTIAEEKVKNKKQYQEKFEKYKTIQDFTDDEKMTFKMNLCGTYPFFDIVSKERLETLERINCTPIGDYLGQGAGWGVIKSYEFKKTGKGADYAVITLIDSQFREVSVRCWSWKLHYEIKKNELYFVKLDYDPKWGLSTRNYTKSFKLIPRKEEKEE